MAQLIIKTKDHIHPDPAIDRQSAYKAGMVIAVFEDAHIFGKMESKQQWLAEGNNAADWHGKTAIIKLPGVAVADVVQLMEDQPEDDAGVTWRDVDGQATNEAMLQTPADYPVITHRRRRFILTQAGWSASRRDELQANGFITSTVGLVQAQIRRMSNGSAAPEAVNG